MVGGATDRWRPTAATFFLVAGCVLGSVACGPHRSLQLVPRYDVRRAPGGPARPPHPRPVFVTEQTLPPDSYEQVAVLDVTKVFYGTRAAAFQAMADMARELGADAVIEARAWFRPVGWALASPQGSGKAVVLKGDDPSALEQRYYGHYR